jgi:hypothetical protein
MAAVGATLPFRLPSFPNMFFLTLFEPRDGCARFGAATTQSSGALLVKDGDPGRSTAESDRLVAVSDVEINPASPDAGARVSHDIDAVMPFVEPGEADL